MLEFWSLLPVKLVAIAGCVYALTATLKLIFPGVTGWKAMAINLGLSVTGVLGVAKPGDLMTVQFWTALMLTTASAAGIHGTIKAATAPPDPLPWEPPPPPPPPRTPGPSPGLGSLMVLCCGLCLFGCTVTTAPTPPAPPGIVPGATSQFDSDTYRTLATAHAFAAQAASNPSVLTPAQKAVLNQFIADLNSADALYVIYHAGNATQAIMQASVDAVTADQAKYAATGVK